MKRNKDLRDFAEQYKNGAGKDPRGLEEDDQPRIVGENDAPERKAIAPVERVVRIKCKVHRTEIEGISYHCDGCGSTFCLACITNVLLPEGKCMLCGAPVVIGDEFRSLVDRTALALDPEAPSLKGHVTTIAPEIWHKFEELEIEEDVVDEIIDRLKYVPPEDRLKYIDAYFSEEDDRDDPP